jgi:hypothetical protein
MSFIVGFVEGYLDRKDKIAARDAFLQEQTEKKRNVFSSQVLPRVVKVQSQRDGIKADMEYLEQRGLDERALNTLYGDPEALKAATSLLREGDGANWSPEEANTYIRAAASDKDPEVSWRDHFNSQADLMKDLLSADSNSFDLDSAISTAYQLEAGAPRSGTVEFPSVPGQAGVDPEMTRRWDLQEKMFNTQVVATAQRRANQLQANRQPGLVLPVRKAKAGNACQVDGNRHHI